MSGELEIRRLSAAEARDHVDALAGVLHAVVAAGASVGYMDPFTDEDARAVFEGFVADAERGGRVIVGAFLAGGLVGAVHVVLELPPNQPHRGEIAKLQVHPEARNRGIAQLLMEAAEAAARSEGKTLLVLDTVAGSPADRLYRRLGWTPFGTVPDFALYPDGRFCDATFFWKRI